VEAATDGRVAEARDGVKGGMAMGGAAHQDDLSYGRWERCPICRAGATHAKDIVHIHGCAAAKAFPDPLRPIPEVEEGGQNEACGHRRLSDDSAGDFAATVVAEAVFDASGSDSTPDPPDSGFDGFGGGDSGGGGATGDF